jgi:hypothetical protein
MVVFLGDFFSLQLTTASGLYDTINRVLLFFRELSSTFARLSHLVEQAKGDLERDISELEQVITRLDDAVSTSKLLK